MNITFIGGGNMARALIGGLIARGHASKALSVVEISPEARATVAARFGVAT
ncbi:MAG: NAD(P)-binding domain-containing protein, partial [Casimicrobiaceae bacterium]